MAAWTNDQRLKPHVRAAADEINKTFGITNIQGYSFRNIAGTNTLSDHAKGLALDVMCTLAVGKNVSAWVVSNGSRLNITYVIWNKQIWQNGAWTAYRGANPHIDHVHVSFSPQPGAGGTGSGTQGFAGDSPDLSVNEGCIRAILKLLGM